MTDINRQLIALLLPKFGEREAKAITRVIMDALREEQDGAIVHESIVQQVLDGVPLQYALGHTWFYGRKFDVSPDVLIPRPETEEMTDLIIKEMRSSGQTSVLDIGTGSGCIAVTLAVETQINVTAIDVSSDVLRIAQKNALTHQADVLFLEMDILSTRPDQSFDIIVSNPPYVTEQEFAALDPGVKDYEPKIALMASGRDPLIFYRRIAELGITNLAEGGSIYVELNALQSLEIDRIFTGAGFQSAVIKDLQGKDRILCARRAT